MGTSRSFGELERKLAQAATNLEKSTPKTVLQAAQAAQDAIDAEIRRRVPDGDMSGLSKVRRSDKSGKNLFFNIIIEGVNMLASERTEVGAMLDKRKGNLDALIQDLKSA